ncbi:MAG: methylase [Betaproteobacteria bacterium RIFCSPLOWO2_02_FULL_66_14]|nr:MAG: methylase [Betaproteobacteria bacterium RIFCSPLOWO2_02_FULL_66_14]
MPLPWNEIRDRAIGFARDWQDAESERAEAQTFWNEFFAVFGVPRRRVASFEEPVRKLGERRGRIDAFWKGILVVEHKSRGQDLDRAFIQALDYFPGIADRDLPKYVLVSDFARFRLYDLDADTHSEFALKDLHKHIKRFGFIAGYAAQEIKPQDPVNIRAAEQMGRLHDLLKDTGYSGHDLEVLLVRLVFCLFADDTGIFSKQSFRDWIETRTAEDGTDLGPQLALLFQVLNTPEGHRQSNLDEQIAAFAYVNGRLFEETLQLATFDRKMRATLLDCCALNWGSVSPAIFGALFQSIMDAKARRNLGAHYTSEENILKLIKPLFLDELWAEFSRIRNNKNRLFEFHKRLRTLVFLDPACGCGNFLVITYRELRLLELELLRAVHSGPGSRFLNIHQELTLDVDQFYGIEIEEFPAQIAQVALWLIDHQMNLKVSEEFGMYFARIPLKTTPHIVHGNALRLDWNEVVPAERLSYSISNPPFVGKQHQTVEQKADLESVLSGVSGAGVLDFVTGWYFKAARYLQSNKAIRCAYVSTNSISQGEQVGVLWADLLRAGIRIHFAHRTFRWSNEARGMAAVHCVVIGFGASDVERKTIFEYERPDGEPHAIVAGNINPYLVDAPDVLLKSRSEPICDVPPIQFGSMPNDGGHLLLTDAERAELVIQEIGAARWIRRFMSAEEFLHNVPRWCLWLKGISPTDLKALPEIARRVAEVKALRSISRRATTKELAAFPTLFGEDRQPDSAYILIPRHSSERRAIVPMGFFGPEVIAADSCLAVPNATLYVFGVLSSAMHNAWIRSVAGRLESRYRYSNQIVYNNFPWPDRPTDKQTQAIESAAQGVLDARAEFADSSLADLYDPLTMPPSLTHAHQALDRAVDAAYGKKGFASDAERVAFLFGLYQRYTSLLPSATPPSARKARVRRAHA